MMIRKVSLLTLAVLVLSSALAAVKEADPAKAKVDLNGNAYMAFVRLGDSGPDPQASVRWPVYMVLGQEGDKLYGAMVFSYKEANVGAPAIQSRVFLHHSARGVGVVKGKRFTIAMQDVVFGHGEVELTGRVRKGGDLIKLTWPGEGGKKVTLRFNRCDRNDQFSGIYISQGIFQDFGAPAAANDLVVGISTEPESGSVPAAAQAVMTYGFVYYQPAMNPEPQGVTGPGAVNTDDGSFNSDSDPDQTGSGILGTINNYIMAADCFIPGPLDHPLHLASAALNYFGSKGNDPKLKTKKKGNTPGPASGEVTLTIKVRNVLPGAFLSEDSSEVYIVSYTIETNTITVVLAPTDSVLPKKVTLTLINPDGRTDSRSYSL